MIQFANEIYVILLLLRLREYYLQTKYDLNSEFHKMFKINMTHLTLINNKLIFKLVIATVFPFPSSGL